MVTPTLCDSRNGVESLGDRSEAPIADYLETIAILQDEVARLEQELQLSNQRQRETTSIDEALLHDEAAAAVPTMSTSLAILEKSSGSRQSWPVAMRRFGY